MPSSTRQAAALEVLWSSTPQPRVVQTAQRGPLPFSLGAGSTGSMISDRVVPEAVAARRTMRDKDRLFAELAALVADAVPSLSADEVEQQLREREAVLTTAMGRGVAIPHATLEAAPRTFMGVMTLTTPVDFGEGSDGPVDVCFCLVGPPSDRTAHLHLLAQIAGAVMESDLLDRMRAAKTTVALLDVLAGPRLVKG
jgi:PTS system nitrogen regulatory IIA component